MVFRWQSTLACLLCIFLLGLYSGAARADQDTLVYSWSSNVGELNPHLYSPNQMFAQAMVYEPLVRYAEGNQVIPWLAENGRSPRMARSIPSRCVRMCDSPTALRSTPRR